jgi:hypothetical protein
MRNVIIAVIISLITAAAINAQQMIWDNTIGGEQEDFLTDIIRSSDSGYMVAGRSGSYTTSIDGILAKTDSSGNELWVQDFGCDAVDGMNRVIGISDGDYVGVGYYHDPELLNDVILARIDDDAKIKWIVRLDYGGEEMGRDIKETRDGGFIIAAHTVMAPDYLLIKTDAAGNSMWSRTLGGNGDDLAYSILNTDDGGYLIGGASNSFGDGDFDIYVVKINPMGFEEWSRTYGGDGDEYGYSMRNTDDGGYIIAGYTTSYGAGGEDLYLVKTDDKGDVEWTRTYGDENNNRAGSVIVNADHGFTLTGSTDNIGDERLDAYVVKTDSLGNMLWENSYGGHGDDWGNGIIQTPEGSYIIAGGSESFGNGSSSGYLVRIFGTPVSIGMVPENHQIQVPQGGSFGFSGALINNSDRIQNNDVWLMLDVPGYGLYGPLQRYNNIPLTPHREVIITGIEQQVPGNAPPGTYRYIAYTGDYPSAINDSSDFEFTVIHGTSPNGAGNWQASKWFDRGERGTAPDVIAVFENYPNPFNAATTINYGISEACHVRIDLFNMMGQHLETLIDSYKQPGTYSAVWHASDFASGAYFYKITTESQALTRRMMLVK